MAFELSEEQRAVAEAVDALLARHAGCERAIALSAKGESDGALERALAEAGVCDLPAEAARGAGHDGYLAGEVEEFTWRFHASIPFIRAR